MNDLKQFYSPNHSIHVSNLEKEITSLRAELESLEQEVADLQQELAKAKKDWGFALVVRSDSNKSSDAEITICNSLSSLHKETLKAVFGPNEKDWDQEQCDSIIEKMKEDGFMDFEGDPPIYWFIGHTNQAIDTAMQSSQSGEKGRE